MDGVEGVNIGIGGDTRDLRRMWRACAGLLVAIGTLLGVAVAGGELAPLVALAIGLLMVALMHIALAFAMPGTVSSPWILAAGVSQLGLAVMTTGAILTNPGSSSLWPVIAALAVEGTIRTRLAFAIRPQNHWGLSFLVGIAAFPIGLIAGFGVLPARWVVVSLCGLWIVGGVGLWAVTHARGKWHRPRDSYAGY